MKLLAWLNELLTPEDSFTQTLRKLTALLNGIMAPFSLAYGFYWCALAFTADVGEQGQVAGAGTALQGFLTLFLGVTMIVNCIFMVKWRHVSDDHMTLILWVIFFPCVGLLLNVPEFGVRPFFIWYAMVTVTTQSRHAVIQGALAVIGQLLSCYNDAFMHTEYALLIPGARLGGPPMEVFGELVGSTIVANSVIVGVYLQGRVYSMTFEQARRGNEARAAVEMSREVVDLLRRYDTDGVQKVLDSYQDSAVDPDLLESYRAMKDNLDMYRPHLPNYIFMKEEDEESVLGTPNLTPKAGNVQALLASVPSPSLANNSITSPTTGNPQAAYTPSSNGSDTTPRRNRPSPSQPPTLSPRTAVLDATTTGSGGGGSSHKNKTISFGWLDYRHLWRPYDMENLTDFVNAVYSNAAATYGSVHSMVGDSVTVSWNATNRVQQPESKAAKFLSRLAAAANKNDYLISGAVCSGPSRCSPITSSTKQTSLLMQVPWIGALQGCFTLAQRYKTAMIDEATHRVAFYDVECRAVDIVRYVHSPEIGQTPDPILLLDDQAAATPDSKTATLAYEIVQELKHDEDEWMYQLNQKANQPIGNDAVTAAMDAVARGSYGEALTHLAEIEASNDPAQGKIWRSPLVQRLNQYCESQLGQ